MKARQLIEGEHAGLPAVEKGIPLPPAAKKDERNKPRSPWPEFLLALEPGDSFVITYPTSQHVMTMAKWMGIPLVRAELPKEQPAARGQMWADMPNWSAQRSELLRVRVWRLSE